MIEVHPGLFVGSQDDIDAICKERRISPEMARMAGSEPLWEPDIGWAAVHACKEPYHRLFVGYNGRAAPKDHPEYLFARRGWRLALNLVDVDNPEYVRPELVAAAMAFIDEAREAGRKCLCHCNQGGSRAPGLALHWLRRNDSRFVSTTEDVTPLTFDVGEAIMRSIYPAYVPAEGIRGFDREHWND